MMSLDQKAVNLVEELAKKMVVENHGLAISVKDKRTHFKKAILSLNPGRLQRELLKYRVLYCKRFLRCVRKHEQERDALPAIISGQSSNESTSRGFEDPSASSTHQNLDIKYDETGKASSVVTTCAAQSEETPSPKESTDPAHGMDRRLRGPHSSRIPPTPCNQREHISRKRSDLSKKNNSNVKNSKKVDDLGRELTCLFHQCNPASMISKMQHVVGLFSVEVDEILVTKNTERASDVLTSLHSMMLYFHFKCELMQNNTKQVSLHRHHAYKQPMSRLLSLYCSLNILITRSGSKRIGRLAQHLLLKSCLLLGDNEMMMDVLLQLSIKPEPSDDSYLYPTLMHVVRQPPYPFTSQLYIKHVLVCRLARSILPTRKYPELTDLLQLSLTLLPPTDLHTWLADRCPHLTSEMSTYVKGHQMTSYLLQVASYDLCHQLQQSLYSHHDSAHPSPSRKEETSIMQETLPDSPCVSIAVDTDGDTKVIAKDQGTDINQVIGNVGVSHQDSTDQLKPDTVTTDDLPSPGKLIPKSLIPSSPAVQRKSQKKLLIKVSKKVCRNESDRKEVNDTFSNVSLAMVKSEVKGRKCVKRVKNVPRLQNFVESKGKVLEVEESDPSDNELNGATLNEICLPKYFKENLQKNSKEMEATQEVDQEEEMFGKVSTTARDNNLSQKELEDSEASYIFKKIEKKSKKKVKKTKSLVNKPEAVGEDGERVAHENEKGLKVAVSGMASKKSRKTSLRGGKTKFMDKAGQNVGATMIEVKGCNDDQKKSRDTSVSIFDEQYMNDPKKRTGTDKVCVVEKNSEVPEKEVKGSRLDGSAVWKSQKNSLCKIKATRVKSKAGGEDDQKDGGDVECASDTKEEIIQKQCQQDSEPVQSFRMPPCVGKFGEEPISTPHAPVNDTGEISGCLESKEPEEDCVIPDSCDEETGSVDIVYDSETDHLHGFQRRMARQRARQLGNLLPSADPAKDALGSDSLRIVTRSRYRKSLPDTELEDKEKKGAESSAKESASALPIHESCEQISVRLVHVDRKRWSSGIEMTGDTGGYFEEGNSSPAHEHANLLKKALVELEALKNRESIGDHSGEQSPKSSQSKMSWNSIGNSLNGKTATGSGLRTSLIGLSQMKKSDFTNSPNKTYTAYRQTEKERSKTDQDCMTSLEPLVDLSSSIIRDTSKLGRSSKKINDQEKPVVELSDNANERISHPSVYTQRTATKDSTTDLRRSARKKGRMDEPEDLPKELTTETQENSSQERTLSHPVKGQRTATKDSTTDLRRSPQNKARMDEPEDLPKELTTETQENTYQERALSHPVKEQRTATKDSTTDLRRSPRKKARMDEPEEIPKELTTETQENSSQERTSSPPVIEQRTATKDSTTDLRRSARKKARMDEPEDLPKELTIETQENSSQERTLSHPVKKQRTATKDSTTDLRRSPQKKARMDEPEDLPKELTIETQENSSQERTLSHPLKEQRTATEELSSKLRRSPRKRMLTDRPKDLQKELTTEDQMTGSCRESNCKKSPRIRSLIVELENMEREFMASHAVDPHRISNLSSSEGNHSKTSVKADSTKTKSPLKRGGILSQLGLSQGSSCGDELLHQEKCRRSGHHPSGSLLKPMQEREDQPKKEKGESLSPQNSSFICLNKQQQEQSQPRNEKGQFMSQKNSFHKQQQAPKNNKGQFLSPKNSSNKQQQEQSQPRNEKGQFMSNKSPSYIGLKNQNARLGKYSPVCKSSLSQFRSQRKRPIEIKGMDDSVPLKRNALDKEQIP